jgi:aspartyl-tRNA(Asn)/glutamyl-tRNA(Gln) amidotransferase subunit C
MSLTKQDIQKIAHLARLEIKDQEVEKYAAEISTTLDLIANMDKVNTDGVTPMAHPLNCTQRLRADDVTEHDERAKFQKIAPQVEAGLYLVPQVIE